MSLSLSLSWSLSSSIILLLEFMIDHSIYIFQQPRSQGFFLEGGRAPSREKPWERGCIFQVKVYIKTVLDNYYLKYQLYFSLSSITHHLRLLSLSIWNYSLDRKVKIIEKTCQADPRSSVKSYTRTLLRFCRIRTCECPFYKYQQRSKAGRTHGDLNKNVAYKKSINQ